MPAERNVLVVASSYRYSPLKFVPLVPVADELEEQLKPWLANFLAFTTTGTTLAAAIPYKIDMMDVDDPIELAVGCANKDPMPVPDFMDIDEEWSASESEHEYSALNECSDGFGNSSDEDDVMSVDEEFGFGYWQQEQEACPESSNQFGYAYDTVVAASPMNDAFGYCPEDAEGSTDTPATRAQRMTALFGEDSDDDDECEEEEETETQGVHVPLGVPENELVILLSDSEDEE